ncbi:MAG: hypothetical protein H0T84_08555 [Tatlockia sp.]|nr:hypothetical protein [Tatlockia sp.]
MPKVLLINLSDEKGSGQKAADSLAHKYGKNNVELCQFSARAQVWNDSPENVDLAIQDIQSYKDIIIAAHGNIGDTKTCYYENFETGTEIPLFSPQKLAHFFNEILSQSTQPANKDLPVTLAICYAARTQDYQLDHVNNPENIPYLETFAGQFLTTLHETSSMNYDIDLSAYTGSVGFNNVTGELEVETEEQIKKSGDLFSIRTNYAKAQTYMNQCVELVEETLREEDYSETEIERYLDNYYDKKTYLHDDSVLGKACKESYRLEAELSTALSQAAKLETEYGKVSYSATRNIPDIQYDTSEILGKNPKKTLKETKDDDSPASMCNIM